MTRTGAIRPGRSSALATSRQRKLAATGFQSLKQLARSKRFELLTPRFVVWCSIQLSYERIRTLLGLHRKQPPRSEEVSSRSGVLWQPPDRVVQEHTMCPVEACA